jgi:hypothetical protein
MAQREGEDALLNERRELIGHPRPAPLARPQGPQPLPLDLPLPNLIGRTVHTEGTAGGTDSDSSGKVDQLQPVAEEHVIMRHATQLLSLGGEGARLSRKSDSAQATAGALSRSKAYQSPSCRENSETDHLKAAPSSSAV